MFRTYRIALTIDGDPDGPAGSCPHPGDMEWRGLAYLLRESIRLRGMDAGQSPVPLTWFVRGDATIAEAYGRADAVFLEHESAWRDAQASGDEIGWHPHLVTWDTQGQPAPALSSEGRAQLESTWELLNRLPYPLRCVRNGEAWHTAETMRTVEALGLTCDSSAVPGCCGPSGHPRDWRGAPNQPYFPSVNDPWNRHAPGRCSKFP